MYKSKRAKACDHFAIIVQARNWCFTLYDDERLNLLNDGAQGGGALAAPPLELDHPHVRAYVYQLERCPETGRLHIQGYVEFTRPKRMGGVKSIIGSGTVHLEQRRGSRNQAIEYCRKENSRVAGPWEHGNITTEPNGRSTSLAECASRIASGALLEDIVDSFPVEYIRYKRGIEALVSIHHRRSIPVWREVTVLVHWGGSGVGKTRHVVDRSKGNFFILDQGERVWFDGYSGESTLIIDDFYGWIKWGSFLRILDGHPYRCEIKGGHIYAAWTTVLITSNKHPSEWYQNHGFPQELRRRISGCAHWTEAGPEREWWPVEEPEQEPDVDGDIGLGDGVGVGRGDSPDSPRVQQPSSRRRLH